MPPWSCIITVTTTSSSSLGRRKIENDIVGKDPFLRTFQDGETVFVPGPFAHTAKNLYRPALPVITVELLQDDKLQPSHLNGMKNAACTS